MRVGAPSSVISSTMETPVTTGPETPTRRIQEVNRWRPNPQSYIDAKSRLAGGSGLSTADLDATARWAPKIGKFAKIGGAAAGGVLAGLELGFYLGDNVVSPIIGLDSDALERTYCTRQANLVFDLIAGVIGGDCGDWRMRKQDEETLSRQVNFTGSVAGYSYVGIVTAKSGGDYYCYSHASTHGWAAGQWLQLNGPTGWRNVAGSGRQLITNGASYSVIRDCQAAFGLSNVAVSYSATAVAGYGRLRLINSSSGEVVEEMREEMPYRQGSWTSKVKCLDGRSVVSSSGSWLLKQGENFEMPPTLHPPANCEITEVETQLTDESGNPIGSPARTTVPTEVQDWMRDFPSCWDGSCVLTLKKTVGTGELDCFDVPDQCVDWFEEAKTQPSKYKCYYAGQLMPIEQCNVYSRVFDRTKVQQGTGYADPETGEEVKTGTGTATTTNPGAAKVAMEQPVKDASQSRECWPTGWGLLNPFEWVLRPVQCALEWAFVPRESAFRQFQSNLVARFSQTSFGAVAGIVAAIQIPGVGDGCTGPPLSFKFGEINETWYPFAACDAPMAGVAGTVKLWLGFLISAGAVFAIIRYVTAIVGFVPYGGSGNLDSGRRGPRFEASDD